MNKTKWYEETPGVISSKRMFGGIAIAFGVSMKISLFFLAVYGHVNDAATATAQADSLIYVGAGLLGLTAVENTFKKGGAA